MIRKGKGTPTIRMGASWLPVVVMNYRARLEKEIPIAIGRWRTGAMHCRNGARRCI